MQICAQLHAACCTVLARCNAGAEHHLDSAIAAAELLDKCPGCAGVLQRGGRLRALVDAALAEQAARVAVDDEDDENIADDDDEGAWWHFVSITAGQPGLSWQALASVSGQ